MLALVKYSERENSEDSENENLEERNCGSSEGNYENSENSENHVKIEIFLLVHDKFVKVFKESRDIEVIVASDQTREEKWQKVQSA
nr:hypothetical protein CFP56_32768 [Quercus suber]